MKSRKEGGFGPPRAVTPWKKKKKIKKVENENCVQAFGRR
jgi:hypothetical protein